MAGLFALAILCFGGAGCTAPPTPTPSSAATTHWKDGVEPTPNDLENTPYVKYLRDIAWAEAIAWNTGDFSIPEYTDHGWEMEATEAEIRYERQGNEAYVHLAPRPFVPLRIGKVAKGDKDPGMPPWEAIYVCEAAEPSFKKMVDPSYNDTLYTKQQVISHTMRKFPDGKVVDMPAGTDETCDDVDVPVALFDNPPTLPELPVTEPKHTAPIATK